MAFKTLGKNPVGQKRLARLQNSANYRHGVFQNIHLTPMNKEGGSTLKTAYEFFTAPKPKDIKPFKPIPYVQTDLKKKSPQPEAPALIWFGHSSYLIQFQGFNILIDPVFSGHASPISSAVQSFPGANSYGVADMPEIDLLILTHDHYDHIDFESVMQLKEKVKHTVCPLGVGEHLEYWGFSMPSFTEMDWWEESNPLSSVKITSTPARHFSGRSLNRNKTLWTSYVIELGNYRLFIGGDSGYDDQFKKIGEKFKSFDLVMLECGQYGVNWPYIHMFPEQTAQAAKDLNARALFPVHWGKFILSVHSWTEPIERLLPKAKELQLQVTTPLIGQRFLIDQNLPQDFWWRGL